MKNEEIEDFVDKFFIELGEKNDYSKLCDTERNEIMNLFTDLSISEKHAEYAFKYVYRLTGKQNINLFKKWLYMFGYKWETLRKKTVEENK